MINTIHKLLRVLYTGGVSLRTKNFGPNWLKFIVLCSSNDHGLNMIDSVHNTTNAHLLCVAVWVCEHM
jgi:hypothetical protein